MTERFDSPKIYTPYRSRGQKLFRWRRSVIPKVLFSTFIVTTIATIVTVLYKYTSVNLSMEKSFIVSVGFVVSFLLGYRTNTAYDRYWEGLRIWSTMVVAIRNMTRIIWINIKEKESKHLLEKETAINLLLGFAIATKHLLREEQGCDHQDLKPYITNIHNQLTEFSAKRNSKTQNKNKSSFLNSIFKNPIEIDAKLIVDKNLPLKISLYISSYISAQKQRGSTDDASISILHTNLCTLVDCLTNLERVLRSPIPLAYAIHLTQVTWLYCLSLPFQLVADLGWVTILVTFVATATLLGIERIGEEIENPFGHDENDLNLDDFCGLLKQELSNITANKPPNMEDWIFNSEVQSILENDDLQNRNVLNREIGINRTDSQDTLNPEMTINMEMK
ncbi:1659_t:CDS:2 [Diversispora eburnea]|uniref:1659_t:CDS:1 n=1 Tax=Diversispora eburnea TaxID=1213867 RepID=A0A9N8W4H6_9GLOM|nr:1659_t:CDS:2 [Diversispora eburnea]